MLRSSIREFLASEYLHALGIPTTRALTEDVAETLPGRPLAVPTPGHTGGHCSYVVDGVLVSGDALVTGHPLLRQSGPQLLPAMFNHSEAGCLASLEVLAAASVPARW